MSNINKRIEEDIEKLRIPIAIEQMSNLFHFDIIEKRLSELLGVRHQIMSICANQCFNHLYQSDWIEVTSA